MASQSWQVKASEACLIRDQSLPPDTLFSKDDLANLPFNVTDIPRTCGKLSPFELDITDRYDATDLLKLLHSGSLTARTVLKAFTRRASVAQQLTNCITELLPEACKDADACDEYLRLHGRPIGPLHGLPVSVKEQFSVGGRRTNASFVAWVDNVVPEDCELVRILKSLGAVVFARTMQPQLLMHLESSNNIYGTCVNPLDTRLTAGGSSGGEAALMAMHGTPLGFGGDIGGSIRCPASFNGVYGFKPTAHLISTYGVTGILSGADSIVGSLGPFTRSKRDLDLVLSAYSSASPWDEDPDLVIYNFETIRPFASRPLRIGILANDGTVAPSDRVAQVFAGVVSKLSNSSQVEIKPFQPFDHGKAWTILQSLYFEGCERRVKEVIESSGEPLLPLTEWILEFGLHSKKEPSSSMLAHQKAKTARDQYRKAYSAHWNSMGVDIVLSPVGPDTALAHGTSKYWNYTAVWNLLDYPALSFPASTLLDRNLSKDTQTTEDASSMPVGLQIIGKRWRDNEVLAALSLVEEALAHQGD